MTVKGGGHSYGAYGLAGAMILDMVEFQEVSLDSDTNIVRVGAGLRLGNMASTLFDLGERAYVSTLSLSFPSVSCLLQLRPVFTRPTILYIRK